jgi:hypothetical protein
LRDLTAQSGAGHPTLAVLNDPAPYNLPPVDLIGWNIVRLPRGVTTGEGLTAPYVIVRPDEFAPGWDLSHPPISWAGKRFTLTEKLSSSGPLLVESIPVESIP